MSYIIEFEIVTPNLQEAIQAVPEMVLEFEDLQVSPDGSTMYVFWAYGDNFEKFEDSLLLDPTVEESKLISEFGDRRLYRVTFTEEGQSSSTYSVVTRHDMTYLDILKTNEGSSVRARIPSREALSAYIDACRERGIPFKLNRIYSEERNEGVSSSSQYGVSDAQRDALVTALKRGYYAIPRETTLEEIADELGISIQALSTRLRRGQTNLLNSTIADGPP